MKNQKLKSHSERRSQTPRNFSRPSNRATVSRIRARANVSSIQAARRTPEELAELVKKARASAIDMMAKAGFKIPDNVRVKVDPQLPIMGYTMPQGKGFTIVVAGGAVGSEMLQGLLVHEMSHIYRIQTNHPSHNAEILEEAVDRLGMNLERDYRGKILHDVLNDIQDLYADDIAFRVFRTNPIHLIDDMPEFIQGMVTDKPEQTGGPAKDGWVNAAIMAHNSRAIAQMARHHIPDTGNKAEQASQRFLSQVSPNIAKEFDFFRNRLTNMREDVTEPEQRAFLAEHLNRFLRAAENRDDLGLRG